MGRYNQDMFSSTAPASRAAAWNTWGFHDLWFQGTVPALPLHPVSVAVVLTLSKEGIYRTPGNYCTVARQMPTAAGFKLDEATKLYFTLGKRSVMRGIGPAHHSDELPVDRLSELDPR